ncbi:hypothetical protein PTKIN_Ptkin13bG0201100 [Pterospermum kingtungense]
MATTTTNNGFSGGGCCPFLLQVIRGRWFMISASFLIMAGAGATYLFGVYSKDIKATLGYDQSTLNLLSTFKDLGANVGVLSGLLAEVTPTWFVLLVGSVMNFSGYFMIWLAVTKRIATPKVWQMCAYICIGANSQNFANTGSLVTCVKNFPESRGMMLGLMKGFVGLSGAVFTQLYYAIYGDDSKSLILLIGWLPAVISLAFVYNIRIMKISSHPNELKVFYEYLSISIVLAFLLMGLTIAQKKVTFSHIGYVVSAFVVCFMLFLPFLIAIREEFYTWKSKKQFTAPSSVIVEAPPPPETAASKSDIEPEFTENIIEKNHQEASCYANICNPPKRGEDYSIFQALLSIDMLLVFVAVFCGLGCSLTAVDNLGQIGESLGYPHQTVSTFVSLLSIWNYFGRVFAGFVSEIILLKYKIPRPLIMAIALFLAAVGDILIAFPWPGSVYIASLLIGFAFGAQHSILFIIVSELFGLKHYSTLFNCAQLPSPLGSYVLNVRIVGKLYDREALKQVAAKGMTRSMVKELTCIGKQCYRLSFSILAAVNIFGFLATMILVFRSRKFYGGDIYKRFRDEMEANEREMALKQAEFKHVGFEVSILLMGTADAASKDVTLSLAEKKPKVVFVLGGPGSGKGTQCAKIVQHFGYTHLSAGDLLRAEKDSGSENGTMIQNMMNEGKIVPSEVTVKLLQKAMVESGNDKFLIDGFPRNEENRAAFEAVTKIEPEFVLFFNCPEEEMERRILFRNQGREDDNIETIRKRFKVFLESSLPVIEYYKAKGKVREIDAAKPVEEVFEAVKAIFTPKVEEVKKKKCRCAIL